ncbi:MAG: molybdopterin-dependent oxidoreductase [Planctomycetes bacterium]|nr:molybdopterin-dependent oxidoreductase [Planctomycetota bacterium]
MPTVYVNDQQIEFGVDERINCVQAAQRVDVEIPHYCWHPALSVVASCRMCLVEVGQKKPDGSVAMQPKLIPGCQTPVTDGMVIVSDSDKVKAAQQATLEYLLLNHPLDCPTCDQAGECYLQDYSYRYGRGYSRLAENKLLKPDKDYIGEQITLFTDRCIMCTRCVRFTREVSGTAELQVVGRGAREEIDIFPGQPCDNKLAGNVVDLCPVGALCSKDFLYKQRVWWLKTETSVCPNCSTGCSINVDQNDDRVYRLRPRGNPLAQGHFMCDEGRFGWKYLHSDSRLTTPEQRQGGKVVSRDWDVILPAVREALVAAGRDKKKGIAAVLSPWMTLEEAYLLASYLKSLSSNVSFALGPVRTVGEDDKYPKDVYGRPMEPVKFTIRAEKCPNCRGIEGVLRHFAGSVVPMGDVLGRAASGDFAAVYLVGGDPEGWITDAQAAALEKVDTVVVQDILPSPASARATFLLPGGSFAERDGTIVNHAGLAQEIHRAIRSPGEAKPDGRILWDLAGRRGLFNPASLRKEMGETIQGFGPLRIGKLGEYGVRLEM